jgi:hypothetical protein
MCVLRVVLFIFWVLRIVGTALFMLKPCSATEQHSTQVVEFFKKSLLEQKVRTIYILTSFTSVAYLILIVKRFLLPLNNY